MTRVQAPELRGRGWLNTGGRALKLADLRADLGLGFLDVYDVGVNSWSNTPP